MKENLTFLAKDLGREISSEGRVGGRNNKCIFIPVDAKTSRDKIKVYNMDLNKAMCRLKCKSHCIIQYSAKWYWYTLLALMNALFVYI